MKKRIYMFFTALMISAAVSACTLEEGVPVTSPVMAAEINTATVPTSTPVPVKQEAASLATPTPKPVDDSKDAEAQYVEVTEAIVPAAADPYLVTLSGDPEEVYQATDYVYLSGRTVNIYLERGVSVPCSILDDYEYVMSLIEEKTGLKYNGVEPYEVRSSMERRLNVYNTNHFDKVDTKCEKFSVCIVDDDNPDPFLKEGGSKDTISTYNFGVMTVRESYADMNEEFYSLASRCCYAVLTSNLYWPYGEYRQFHEGMENYMLEQVFLAQDRYYVGSWSRYNLAQVVDDLTEISITPENAEEMCNIPVWKYNGGDKNDPERVYYRMVKYMVEERSDVDISIFITQLNRAETSFKGWTDDWLSKCTKNIYGEDFYQKFAKWNSLFYTDDAKQSASSASKGTVRTPAVISDPSSKTPTVTSAPKAETTAQAPGSSTDKPSAGAPGKGQLVLSGSDSEYFTADGNYYILGENVNIFLKAGVTVPCSILEDYEYLYRKAEEVTGLSFHPTDTYNRMPSYREWLSFVEEDLWPEVENKTDKLSIVVKNDARWWYPRYSNDLTGFAIVLNESDADLQEAYFDTVKEVCVEMCRLLFSLNVAEMPSSSRQIVLGYALNMGDELMDSQDRFYAGRRYMGDAYFENTYTDEITQVTAFVVTKDNAENYCTREFSGDLGISFGYQYMFDYRMVRFLNEEYPEITLREFALELNRQSEGNLNVNKIKKITKYVYGDDVYTRFAEWYDKEYQN